METMITLTCHYCGGQFDRRLTEHKRTVRKKRHAFCSHSCSVTWANGQGLTNHPPGNAENLVPGNRRDEYTPFRYFARSAKKRKQEYELDLPYLKTLWEKQDGQCPLTGWQIHLPPGAQGFRGAQPGNASLDRIDNSRGYVKGNVRYVALIANLARNIWDDEALEKFAHAVVRRIARI